MDSSFWFDTIKLEKSIRASGYNLKNILFFCPKAFFTFTNSVDPDECSINYAAFHLGRHCLQK